jgi:hypothetical protein
MTMREHARAKRLPPTDNGEAGEAFPFAANVPNGEAPEPAQSGAAAAPADAQADQDHGEFSRAALRLDQNFTAAMQMTDRIHTLAVDKPPAECWFRVHPDYNDRGEEMFFDTMLLHLKNGPDRGVYQVGLSLLKSGLLDGEKLLKPTRLVLTVDRQKEYRLWPLRLPADGGREDDWMTSALAVAEEAKHRWVRLVAGTSGYKSRTTVAALPEPVWPAMTFDELMELGFAKRRLKSPDDPTLLRLLGGGA